MKTSRVGNAVSWIQAAERGKLQVLSYNNILRQIKTEGSMYPNRIP